MCKSGRQHKPFSNSLVIFTEALLFVLLWLIDDITWLLLNEPLYPWMVKISPFECIITYIYNYVYNAIVQWQRRNLRQERDG